MLQDPLRGIFRVESRLGQSYGQLWAMRRRVRRHLAYASTTKSLRDRLIHRVGPADQYLHTIRSSFFLNDLLEGSSLNVRRSELYGLSVLVATHDQLTSALTVIELDDCARRITILPPDVETDQIGAVMVAADIDA